MKYLLVFLFCIVAATSYSQIKVYDDMSLTTYPTKWGNISVNFVFNDSVMIECRGKDCISLTLYGDTMQIIKNLLILLKDRQVLEHEYWNVVEASIRFANQVPDIYKTAKGNCAWPEYYGLLKGYGFYTQKKTKGGNSYLNCK